MKNLKGQLESQYAIPVIRETDEATLENICLALAEGGLRVFEITLMSDTALKVIERLSKKAELSVGAGTVLTADQAKSAIDAGARFLVSPGLNEEAVKVTQQRAIPFIPGVMTPSEIMKAQALHCEFVKVFPISQLGGTNYLKALQGPFPSMKWMATGGISINDFKLYMSAGCSCVGLGGQLIPSEIVKAKDWHALSLIAKSHVEAVHTARAK